MKKFILIGAAGYVAPKHMKAIKEVGGELVACLDPHSSVGILDSYFPNCKYFSEFERFDRYCSEQNIDYCVVCSPNYLHDAHCRFGLRIGADVICEKPLVLKEHNLAGLLAEEAKTGHRIWNILQLRLGSIAKELKKRVFGPPYAASVLYNTPRGRWYDYTWKADVCKSGGLATNIGIHIFDLLLWLFGTDYTIQTWRNTKYACIGQINIGHVQVVITLSIRLDMPPKRVLQIGDKKFELSNGFHDLHAMSYREILAGNGFGIKDVRPAIGLCEKLRSF